MLTQERFERIVELVNQRGSITSQELTELLQVSESTIRRDLNELARTGQIFKVHGGAMALSHAVRLQDEDLHSRRQFCAEEKRKIARTAAALIEDGDLVYLDAGSTTEYMIEYVRDTKVIFVTNAAGHARALAQRGLMVYLPGGRMKPVTEAIVGTETVLSLSKYNFSKGFFGTNGISIENGLTTPDIEEAAVKELAASRCMKRYVLCDSSKFDRAASVRFGKITDFHIIAGKVPGAYQKYSVTEVEK